MSKEQLIYAQAKKEIEDMDSETLEIMVLDLKVKHLSSLTELQLAEYIYDYNS